MTRIEFFDELTIRNNQIRNLYIDAIRVWFKKFKFDRIILESSTFGSRTLTIDEFENIMLDDTPIEEVPLLQVGEFYNSLTSKISDSL